MSLTVGIAFALIEVGRVLATTAGSPPVTMEIRRLTWSGRPSWNDADFLTTVGTSITIRTGTQILLLVGNSSDDTVRLQRDRSTMDIPESLRRVKGLPTAVVARVLALELHELENQLRVAWYYHDESHSLYRIERVRGLRWQVTFTSPVPPEKAALAYRVQFDDRKTPRFQYWNGRSAVLFERGQYGIGYSYLLRFTRECPVVSLWSDLFPLSSAKEEAQDDLQFLCNGVPLLIPTKGLRFDGPLAGLDGSISVFVEGRSDWLWYLIR